MPLILLLLFFISGLASLIYEVTWLKLLAGSLSNSSHALSLVLAGFLLGLAVGARWCGSRKKLHQRPVRNYAWIELSIALLAVGMPVVLRLVSEASFAWLPTGVAHGVRLFLAGALM